MESAIQLPELNQELLEDTVRWAIESYQADLAGMDLGWDTYWDQCNWFCGTTCCIAGQALYSQGFVEKMDKPMCGCGDKDCDVTEGSNVTHKIINMDKIFGPDYLGPTESYEDTMWSFAAAELLGLTSGEADRLFSGENDIKDVVHFAREIIKSRGLTPNV